MMGIPFVYQTCHYGSTLLVNVHLLLGHWHKKILVLTCGQLKFHVAFPAANQSFSHKFAHGIEILVAQHLATLVCNDTFLTEQVVWTKAELVNKFHH